MVRKGRNLKFCKKKIDFGQIAKTASQRNEKHLLVLKKVLLPGFITFSWYGKLLKMCPKMAAESPLRGAKPRWTPQRETTDRIELKVIFL